MKYLFCKTRLIRPCFTQNVKNFIFKRNRPSSRGCVIDEGATYIQKHGWHLFFIAAISVVQSMEFLRDFNTCTVHNGVSKQKSLK